MSSALPIYLDYNATTPVDRRVAEAMMPYLTTHFGNPSSSHAFGRRASEAVRQARAEVASMLAAAPDEIIFMSGGTETINYVLKGAADHASRSSGRRTLVTSCVEHVAVLESCRALEAKGFNVEYLAVEPDGRVSVDRLRSALTEDVFMVSLMHANNEVGSLNDIPALVRAVKERDPSILFHTDASQSVGKVPVRVDVMGVDFLTVAGHKLYACKGVGALFASRWAPHLPNVRVGWPR